MGDNQEQGLSQEEPREDSALQTPQGDQAHPPVEERQSEYDDNKDESASPPVEVDVDVDVSTPQEGQSDDQADGGDE